MGISEPLSNTILQIAIFNGDESFFPGAAAANRAFRQFLTEHLEGTYGDCVSCHWGQLPQQGKAIAIGFSRGAMQLSLLPNPRLIARIAVDGWCVPFDAAIPTYRLSHDWPTHANGILFGAGIDQFYADPFVEHLRLWASPNSVEGWQLNRSRQERRRTTAAAFLLAAIAQHAPAK